MRCWRSFVLPFAVTGLPRNQPCGASVQSAWTTPASLVPSPWIPQTGWFSSRMLVRRLPLFPETRHRPRCFAISTHGWIPINASLEALTPRPPSVFTCATSRCAKGSAPYDYFCRLTSDGFQPDDDWRMSFIILPCWRDAGNGKMVAHHFLLLVRLDTYRPGMSWSWVLAHVHKLCSSDCDFLPFLISVTSGYSEQAWALLSLSWGFQFRRINLNFSWNQPLLVPS